MTQSQCELCNSQSELSTYEVARSPAVTLQNTVLLCSDCRDGLKNPDAGNARHWHCLHESIWSESPAVKVLAWRILDKLSSERWAQDLLDQLYMDEELLSWAKTKSASDAQDAALPQTRDSNGTPLNNGDSVTLIKDLDVKGANFTAKRGTLVKNIVLTDDPGLIEGRVNGTQIVLKTCFLKRAN